MPKSTEQANWLKNNITEVTTDGINLEQNNPRYYRTWSQKKFPWLYQLFGIDLKEPQHHSSSKHLILRHLERFLSFRTSHPKLAFILQYIIPIILLSAIPFAWLALPNLISIGASTLFAAQITTTIIAAFSSILISTSQWIGNHVFGNSVAPFDNIYKADNHDVSSNKVEDETKKTYEYGDAKGVLTIKKGYMPKLSITSKNHHDAGYVEGYMQGQQIKIALKNLNYLYNKARTLIGAPKNDADLYQYLQDIQETIPPKYIEEMKAKVQGYNKWREENELPKNGDLEYYKYLLLQLLPDVHHYNPFKTVKNNNGPDAKLNPAIKIGTPVNADVNPSPGCTTIAFEVKGYTCYVRILDWPGYDVAGKSFIEVERDIDGYKKTTDASLCLLSGCVTTVNEDQVLTQINVSRVEKVGPQGMPGAFMIRYLAENSASVAEMKKLLENGDQYIKKGPLSGMHISATDGQDTISFHAYQGTNRGHVLETMGTRPMVVPNFGFNHQTQTLVDHHDSSARLENINHFFKHNPPKDVINDDMNMDEHLPALREYMSQIMKLDLVNNFESVYAGLYIYKDNQLVDSHAATNNLYAGSRDVDELYKLTAAM